jgi:hypothetical protein
MSEAAFTIDRINTPLIDNALKYTTDYLSDLISGKITSYVSHNIPPDLNRGRRLLGIARTIIEKEYGANIVDDPIGIIEVELACCLYDLMVYDGRGTHNMVSGSYGIWNFLHDNDVPSGTMVRVLAIITRVFNNIKRYEDIPPFAAVPLVRATELVVEVNILRDALAVDSMGANRLIWKHSGGIPSDKELVLKFKQMNTTTATNMLRERYAFMKMAISRAMFEDEGYL